MDWIGGCLIITLYLTAVSTLKNETRLKRQNKFEREMTCEEGWYSFGEKCYKIGTHKKKILELFWPDSLRHCMSIGGTLATVDSKELSDFLSMFLILGVGKNVWIGLNDVKSEGTFYWEDGTPVNYTNWAENEPSHDRYGVNDEDCAEMRFFVPPKFSSIGEWNDQNCGVIIPCICQKDKIEMALAKTPVDAKFCSEENNSGWKFLNSCFNLIIEKKTWNDAENYCKDNYGGHLVTLRDVRYDMFIDYKLKDFKSDVWIGIRIKESATQKWSSGWFVGYSGWKRKKKDFVEGSCATRTGLGTWGYESCTKKFAFVCESSTDIPPVLTQSVKGAVCPEEPDDWIDLGGDMCYYIETESILTWYQGSFTCMQRGGTLVSIHSKEELDILEPFIKYGITESVLIGLHSDAVDVQKYIWSDHSPNDFENWEVGQPDRDVEHCTVVFWNSMKYHDHWCDEPERRGYICSVRKALPHTNPYAGVVNGTHTTTHHQPCTSCISPSLFAGVIVIIFIIEVLLGIIWLCYVKPRRKQDKKHRISVGYITEPSSGERYRMSHPASFDVSKSEEHYEDMS